MTAVNSDNKHYLKYHPLLFSIVDPCNTIASRTDGAVLIAFLPYPRQRVGAVSAHSDPAALQTDCQYADSLKVQGWHAFESTSNRVACGKRRTRVGEPLSNSSHRQIHG